MSSHLKILSSGLNLISTIGSSIEFGFVLNTDFKSSLDLVNPISIL
jgi:hypothetical protein